MKTLQPDLFPETLLVSREGDWVFTTSLKVAEHFRKQHQHVLRTIRAIMAASPEEVSRSNFGPREYLDARGKRQPIIDLSHDGFAVAVMSFTGPEALEWKWRFLEAFRDMERQLTRQKEREAGALYRLRPKWAPIVQHPQMRRGQLIELTGHKSPGSITACKRRMRQVGLLDS
jgi:Rha family phage regulatory protein